MPMKCMTPGCSNFAQMADVLCPACRRQSDNCVAGVAFFPLEAYDAYHADDLAEDLAAVAGHLTRQAQADAGQIARRETVIRRQQARLDLRERIIRKLMRQRDEALDQATAECARADGLQAQVDGLHDQIVRLQAELDQVYDLASTNGKKPGLAVVDTAPGDYTPEHAGYNRLWAKIDPDTLREICWRWFRV
jgi:hypothetical protein